MLSKHHYAIQLGLQDNKVFFLNPPSHAANGVTVQSTDYQNVQCVDYSPVVRGQNKIQMFFRRLGEALTSMDIRKIKKQLAVDIDIVWSFDPYRFQNMKLFHAPLTIFHPVDIFNSKLDLRSAQTADLIFSVSDVILRKYANLKTPTFFINHGVSPVFLKEPSMTKKDGIVRCGYVGNMLSFALHHDNLLRIVSENSGVEFHFIGPCRDSNLGKHTGDSAFIDRLSSLPNARMEGEMSPADVAARIALFDLFLLCYDAETFGDIASNSHKIIEYLSTGKIIVSSYMSSYQKLAEGLFEMVVDSKELPPKFKEVVNNLSAYNLPEQQKRRKDFARQNTYDQHIKTIESIIDREKKMQ